jgi:hypothetical protein
MEHGHQIVEITIDCFICKFEIEMNRLRLELFDEYHLFPQISDF